MEAARWTLDQLAERVGAALAVDYPGQPSGRVRDVPDRRAIRWYTTIGLIDRPLGHRGRTALYGPRHLLQLVAVKRLQASGLPLVAIQQQLAGATDDQLARVARLPAPGAAAAPGGGGVGAAAQAPAVDRTAARRLVAGPARRAATSPGRAAFWRQPPNAGLAPAGNPKVGGPLTDPAPAAQSAAFASPAPATTAPATTAPVADFATSAPATTAPAATPAALAPAGAVASLRGVRLGGGATLLLEPERELDAADVRAILEAAGPLLEALRARGLDRAEHRREHP